MKKILAVAALVFAIGGWQLAMADHSPGHTGSVGNPIPGTPHDTIIIHVQKADNGPKGCAGSVGGHSLFLRHYAGVVPPTYIYITMIDWVQVDNDGDGLKDEDPLGDANGDTDPNDDFDVYPPGDPKAGQQRIDEDGLEPGAVTQVLDCDSWGDSKVSLQIRDTDPQKDWVSLQKWFLRLIGKPNQNFAFTSYANQQWTCTVLPGPDGILETTDDIAQCKTTETNTTGDWIRLTSFNAEDGGCVKQVKGAGGGGAKAGGKTPFCDITDGFEVDVDYADGTSAIDAFIFGVRVGCLNDPLTTVDESLYCPLSGIVWGTDEDTTSQAKAQIFVANGGIGSDGTVVGSVNVKTGRIKSAIMLDE
ncbi:MAG: hypothetical protein A3H28_03335 [Acidobacteria bacterium RIFCSPLOWO2_02_FULL_61_28]|nr:MAG: hypothetical protein A3H28_03335 [Acidobacteria bacterium RIFCSPLOWO2_02_FULL_61_28]